MVRTAALVVIFSLLSVVSARRAMPWMCLEVCNQTSAQIKGQMDQIYQNLNLFSRVSFELFNLGPNGILVRNNLTVVHKRLTSWGVETFPMISSFPYPKEFISWMRQLFNDSAAGDRFISTCIDIMLQEHFTGLNVDWEPHVGATPQDALDYANFLNKFAKRAHAYGKQITVDIGGWSPIWDWKSLAATEVDKVITMSTYTNNFTRYLIELKAGINIIGAKKLGVGLSTMNLKTNQPFNLSEIQWRFDSIKNAGVNIDEIDMWLAPVPDNWLPFINNFLGGTRGDS